MANPESQISLNPDENAANRKQDHIHMALQSQLKQHNLDSRFYYEPILGSHDCKDTDISISFLGKHMQAPIWVSSMTGGTANANTINKNLAMACSAFGLGMGLGSCRQLLYDDTYFEDFNVRKYIGNQPLYANLGIAQIESLLSNNQFYKVKELVDKLQADGLIIHVNPLQEWLQPEGDRISYSPLETIKRCLDMLSCQIIIKEVGQGMGPKSLEALMNLPISAIDFAAAGGTNFSMLEILRAGANTQKNYENLTKIGHSAGEMINFVNSIYQQNGNSILCKQFIISGGISDFLDGYHSISSLSLPAVYGQASALLSPALQSYEALYQYLNSQIEGYKLAQNYLVVKK